MIKWIHESAQSIQKKAEQEEKGTRTNGTNRKYSKMADLKPTYPYSHRKQMAWTPQSKGSNCLTEQKSNTQLCAVCNKLTLAIKIEIGQKKKENEVPH